MSDFQRVELNVVSQIGMGQSPDSSSYNGEGRGYPFLQGCAEFGDRHPSTPVFCDSPTRIAPKGSVLISVRAPVGEINWSDKDYCIGRGLAYVAEGDASINYLYYAIQQQRHALERISQGSTFLAINSQDLRQLSLDLPPLPEQRKIARILSTVDEVIERTDALIAKYQAMKQGLMHDLLTRGVDAQGRLRPPREQAPELYRWSEMGWVPRGWEVKALQDIADVSRGQFTHRPRNDPAFYGGEFPFIQTGDIAKNVGKRIRAFSQTLSEKGTSVSLKFPAGTIAVTIAANIADTTILDIPMYFPDSVVGVVVKENQSIRYVELCIRNRKRVFDALAPQSAQKNINLHDLRPMLIAVPSPTEQEKISNIYESIEDMQISHEMELHKFQLLKTGLMQDLLTGRVRVKLDQHDLMEEQR